MASLAVRAGSAEVCSPSDAACRMTAERQDAFLAGFVIGIIVAVLVGWAVFRCCTWCSTATVARGASTPPIHVNGRVRDVSVQAPVTYTRHRSEPRFQPLAEHAWGAW